MGVVLGGLASGLAGAMGGGAVATAISSTLVYGAAGLGLYALMSGSSGSSSMDAQGMYDANLSEQQALLNYQLEQNKAMTDEAISSLPKVPGPPTGEEQLIGISNYEANAAREKELGKLAAAEEANKTNPTGGLGARGPLTTDKNQLIGM